MPRRKIYVEEVDISRSRAAATKKRQDLEKLKKQAKKVSKMCNAKAFIAGAGETHPWESEDGVVDRFRLELPKDRAWYTYTVTDYLAARLRKAEADFLKIRRCGPPSLKIDQMMKPATARGLLEEVEAALQAASERGAALGIPPPDGTLPAHDDSPKANSGLPSIHQGLLSYGLGGAFTYHRPPSLPLLQPRPGNPVQPEHSFQSNDLDGYRMPYSVGGFVNTSTTGFDAPAMQEWPRTSRDGSYSDGHRTQPPGYGYPSQGLGGGSYVHTLTPGHPAMGTGISSQRSTQPQEIQGSGTSQGG